MQHLPDPTWHLRVSIVAAMRASVMALAGILVIALADQSAHKVHSSLDDAHLGFTPFTTVATSPLNSTPWLPIVTNNWRLPAIAFTFVLSYGSFQDLQGQVTCDTPADYKVGVYIFVYGDILCRANGLWDLHLGACQSSGLTRHECCPPLTPV